MMTPSPDRRLNAGSWAALIYAGAMLVMLVAMQVGMWYLPTDGWNMAPGGKDATNLNATLQVNVAGIPSALQPGDVVTHVDGVPVIDYLVRGFEFWRYAPPDWHDGSVVQYTVQRGGQTLDVNVPLKVVGPAAHILGSMTLAVGVVGLAPALLEVLASIAFALVTVFVFVVRPREPASHALLIMGLPFFFQHYYMISSLPALGTPAAVYAFLFLSTWALAILPGFLYLTLVFPTPKRPVRRHPRLTALLVFAGGWLLQIGPFLVYPGDPVRALALQRITSFGLLIYLILPIIAVAHSVATVREPVARAQLKWVVLGLIGFAVGSLAFAFGGQAGWTLVVSFVQNGGYLMLPVCVAIAVVRHRLFDIDVIIRRTLVYAIVSVVLAGVFYGAVLVLQRLFATVTGQTSPVAIVASTLAIAALFSPLRRRVQNFVDRRFYRRKYDAQRVLGDFGRVARSETDVDALSSALGAALQDTMQPSALGVWLQSDERR